MPDYGKENREYMERLKDRPGHAERMAELQAWFDSMPEPEAPIDPSECTLAHREPMGPNEDLAVCPACWMPTYSQRPEGETFGWHLADCSLPLRHAGYCVPGGDGHPIPVTEKIRGYFGPTVVFPAGAKSATDGALPGTDKEP